MAPLEVPVANTNRYYTRSIIFFSILNRYNASTMHGCAVNTRSQAVDFEASRMKAESIIIAQCKINKR